MVASIGGNRSARTSDGETRMCIAAEHWRTNCFGSWIPNSLSNYRHGKQNVGLQLTYRVHWSVHFLIYPGFPTSYHLRMCNRTKELLLLSARKPAIKEMKMWMLGGWSIKIRRESREMNNNTNRGWVKSKVEKINCGKLWIKK